MTSNRELFAAEYERQLRRAVETRPDQYCWPVEQVPAVAAKMMAAWDRRAANKDGLATVWTCKALGIKHTYTAIEAYLAGAAP